MNRVTPRVFAAVALAAVLAVSAAPVVHGLPAEGGTVLAPPASLWKTLTGWIVNIFAASGTESDAGPDMDPNGLPQTGPYMDPDGLAAGPEVDPDGTQGEAGPHMDPNG